MKQWEQLLVSNNIYIKTKLFNDFYLELHTNLKLKSNNKYTLLTYREKSRIIKHSRTLLLEARNKSLIKILNEVQLKLKAKIQNDRNFYAELMINLILEVREYLLEINLREWLEWWKMNYMYIV